MTAYEVPKAPHITRLLELYDAGERDYAVLAHACGMTRRDISSKLSAYQRIEEKSTEQREYVKVRLPRAIRRAAEQRGVKPCDLANSLIYTIARDDLVNAVLDDGGEAA
jgi:hypothetical protein